MAEATLQALTSAGATTGTAVPVDIVAAAVLARPMNRTALTKIGGAPLVNAGSVAQYPRLRLELVFLSGADAAAAETLYAGTLRVRLTMTTPAQLNGLRHVALDEVRRVPTDTGAWTMTVDAQVVP